jgi:sugar lactone lactonase YvrE
VLYRLPLGRAGALPAADAAETLTLSGDWEQVEGFNANGITTTPDRSGLLVINSTTGVLHRVDPATGETSAVDLDGASLAAGDGMLLKGRTLYVVRNQLNVVAVVELDRTGTSGTVVDELTSGDFDIPTTVAMFAGALYLPNARFTTPQEPTTEFWVTRVDLRP